MADVTSSLVLAVDSRQVRNAEGDLRKMAAAGDRGAKSANDLRQSFSGLSSVLAGLSLGFIVKETIQLADAYNNITARTKLATSSTRDFVNAQTALFNIAQNTRSGLSETADLFASLTRATESLGKSQSDVLSVTDTINKALVVSGANAQGAAAALIQLGQGFASGTLRGEELNSVLEQAPRLARAIAEGMGVSVGELRKLGEEGELTAEKVFAAIQKAALSINVEFEKMPLTVSGAFTQVQNSLLLLVGNLDEATGATAALSSLISDAAGLIKDFADEVKRGAEGATDIGFLSEAFLVLVETLKVLYANVKFVFQGMGREIGAIAAQIVALGSLDIEGFNAISQAVKEDAARARAELDKLEQDILNSRRNAAVSRPDTSYDDLEAARLQRNRRIYQPAARPTKTRKSAGRSDIPDVLGFDVQAIKNELDSLNKAYSTAQTLLEARRQAALIDEQSYYNAKLAFIKLETDAQTRALAAENARYNSEIATLSKAKGNNKEILDLRKKIAENEAAIAIARASGAAEMEVLAIQEKKRLDDVKLGFQQAEAAAVAYLAALQQAQRDQTEGMGLGVAERRRREERRSIQEQYLAQRQQLEMQRRAKEVSEEQYADELDRINRFQTLALDSFDRAYQERLSKQQDFFTGFAEAVNNYVDMSNDLAGQSEQAFTSAFDSMSSALTQFVMTGKLSFRDLAASILESLIRIQTNRFVAQLLNYAFNSGSQAYGMNSSSWGMDLNQRASGGSTPAWSRNVVNERGPELLEVNGKTMLMMGAQDGRVIPNSGMGGGVTQTISIDARGADMGVEARIRAAVQEATAKSVAAVKANADRGGNYAKSLGRRRG